MAITFNEAYYLQSNADVATAVSLGFFKSGLDHFNKIGARELRSPNAVFDAKYYATQNPDVLAAVSAGTFASVYDHYVKFGLAEGRAPNASLKGFDAANYLATYPDLAKGGVTAATALAHYVQFGVDEGRSYTSSTAGAVTGNYAGTTGDDIVTPAGGQASTVRVEGGQQGAAGDTLVITSGSAASFQVINLGTETGDQNQTRDNTTGTGGGNKVGPVVQGFENVDGRQATINLTLTALDRTSITNTGSTASAQTGSVILGGTGRDTLLGNTGNDSISGGDGNDIIGYTVDAAGAVTAGNGNGNDTLDGGAGNDVIRAGAGADVITDGTGDDTVFGDAGADTITVGAGTNSIDGGADNDTITLAADQATTTTVSIISGNTGNDTIVLNATAITAASRVSVSGGAGNDTITAGLGVETINAGAGNDTVKFTSANLGATDVFNGNDGQDFLQLEIPTGSGTNTYVLTPVNGQFAGFEGIELIDSSGNTNAKQYKIVLTDNFVANNLVSGSFLIDARGLPGGSNLVIDFSALTSASAARFAANLFRVLASPSTDIRDQNNNTITNTYLVNATNSALSATPAFSVYAGDTTVTAGTRNADGTINTNGQAAYTTTGGSVETTTGTTSYNFTLGSNTASNALTTTLNNGFTPSTGFLTSSAEFINASTFLATGQLIADLTSGDGDRLDATLTTTVAPTIVGIETLNITSFGGGLNYAGISGVTSTSITGTSFTATNVANAATFNLSNTFGAQSFTLANNTATDSITLNLNATQTGTTLTTAAAIETINLNVQAASTLSVATLTAASTVVVTGSANLSLTNGETGALNHTFNASGFTGNLTYTDATATGNTTLVSGGTGNDTFNFTAASGSTGGLTNVDTINGGNGTDTINAVATAASAFDSVTNVESIVLTGAASAITTVEALVAASSTLTVTAASATGALTFNGAAETDGGRFNVTGSGSADVLTGGSASDTLVGGAGNDTLVGGIGGDVLTGGTGADMFTYTTQAATISTVSNFDVITDFSYTEGDRLDVTTTGAVYQAGTITGATLTAAITAALTAATTAAATNFDAAGDVVFLTYSGALYAVINSDANSVLSANDTVVQFSGFTGNTGFSTVGSLTVADYVI